MGPRAAAFRGFVNFLKADKNLARVVRTWRAWEGSQADDQLPEGNSALPWVRLTPEFGSSERVATLGGKTLVNASMFVTIETAVEGTRLEDSANLWDAIEARVMNQDATTRAAGDAALYALGIKDVETVQPAIVVNDGAIKCARGRLRLDLSLGN
jgi:hypothetical protein